MIVYIFVASYSQEIVLLIAQNKNYYSAYQLIPILGFAYIFHAANYYFTVILSYAKKTTKLLQASLITAIMTIILNMIIIPYFKIYGAAMINVLSTFILFVLMSFYSKREWGKYFELNKLASMIVIGLIIVIANNLIFSDINKFSILIKFLICLTFPFLLYPLKFYEQIEIDKIAEFASGVMKKFRKN
jgi:O-antigen/teichoic acid export membrane protein